MADYRIGEKGRLFRLSTGGLDMSSSTTLRLKFTKPNGTDKMEKTNSSANAVTAPAVALTNDPAVGTQSANTYFEFATLADDADNSNAATFDVAGTWKVCGIFEKTTDSPPRILMGNDVTFTVLPACD